MSHYINNSWIEGKGPQLQSKDPLGLESVWSGNECSPKQATEAIQVSRQAFASWSNTSFEMRCELVRKYAEILKAHQETLAQLISKEMGKPLWESKTEVQAMISKVELSIKAHLDRCAETNQVIGEAKSITRFHPIGVCLVLGPFNLPAHLPNGHIIPALLAGNTVIFKPSEKTPAVGEAMVQYLAEAGFPNGVIQLIQGGVELSQHCVHSPDIDIIAFTGSYRAGVEIHKACAGHPEKMLALEMGGNNPLVIWEPEDLSMAAYTALLSTYITSGQRCVCARRLIIPHGKEGDDFLSLFISMIQGIQVKVWTESPEGFMGPVIDGMSGQHILHIQNKAIDSGAQIHTQCEKKGQHDALLSPGLLEWKDEKVFRQVMGDHEVFGPLLNCFRAESFEHAIDLANQTQYGLAAGLVAKPRALWEQFRGSIRAGITNWNRQITGAFSSAPFGGVGYSGNFRPSAYFAADYCSYPSASIEVDHPIKPDEPITGLEFKL